MSNILLERYCASMAKQNTLMRKAIPAAKRLTIFLDWANSGSPHQHLARTYEDSKAAVCIIIHDAVFILCKEFVLSMIAFPEGDDLSRVIHEFSSLCSLPCCAGAMNGTFMKIDGKLRSHANGVTLNFVARSTWLSYYLYVLVRESPSPLQDTGASMHWAPPACSCLPPLCLRFGLAGALGGPPLEPLENITHHPDYFNTKAIILSDF